MRILVTGFEPFGNNRVNPSIEAVKLIPERIKHADILKLELPVVFNEGADLLIRQVHEILPDAVICTGLAADRKMITPEVRAVNLREARLPDNHGYQPKREKISPDGPDELFSTLPVMEMTNILTAYGIPAALSFSAGTYVCNEVMYALLACQRESFPDMTAGFVHVPYATEFSEDRPGVFSMPVMNIRAALELCIREVVKKQALSKSGMI